ncbi:MAG: nuclear transport factor 2 family protein [Phycisphaerales bacterium]
MHASSFVATLALALTTGAAFKPPTYVPPTDKEKEDAAVRERLDAERALIARHADSLTDEQRQKLAAQFRGEVDQVLDSFHLFAARAMFTQYFALMHDDGVFLGTDATERWTKGEFMDYARPFMVEQGRGWEYHPRDRHVAFDRSMTTAWFDELLDNDKYGVLRGSGVLVATDDGWKIMQYNLAFTVPNDKAGGVVDLIRGEEKDGD